MFNQVPTIPESGINFVAGCFLALKMLPYIFRLQHMTLVFLLRLKATLCSKIMLWLCLLP